MTGRWWPGLGLAAVVSAVGWAAVWAMDFGPRPLGWVLLSVLVWATLTLVVRALGASPARWRPTLAPAGDRLEESFLERRILDSHAVANEPSAALRDRLVELARRHDPGLDDPLLSALASGAPRRLSLEEIDRHLTRIEALREHD